MSKFENCLFLLKIFLTHSYCYKYLIPKYISQLFTVHLLPTDSLFIYWLIKLRSAGRMPSNFNCLNFYITGFSVLLISSGKVPKLHWKENISKAKKNIFQLQNSSNRIDLTTQDMPYVMIYQHVVRLPNAAYVE